MTTLLLTFLTWIALAVGDEDILVTLPNGVIRGRQDFTATTKQQYYSFLSIPYAAPPIGKLRFRPPTPPDNWTGILNTTETIGSCYQVNADFDNESEDCLHLNVYTPQLPDNSNQELLPVMFYIHGGGFIQGSSGGFGPQFLIEEGVVIITINYRLGPFGFLSMSDEIIPGNNGLKDQLFALQWTRDNIKLFGGDPDRVIIFGQSAGAASATYHLLNPQSQGLFRGVIAESGAAISPWAFQRHPRNYALILADFVAADKSFGIGDDSEELLNHLQGVSAEEIDEASDLIAQIEGQANRQLSQGFFFAPVIEPEHDGAFITEKMYGSLKAGNFTKVPLLIGINSEECITEAADLNALISTMIKYDENLDWLVPDDMQIDFVYDKQQIGKKIRNIYANDSIFEEHLGDGIRYLSDTSFTRSVIKYAELHSQFADVFFYQFSYDGIIGNVSTTIKGADKVSHSEETLYLWNFVVSGYDNSDLSVFPESDQMTAKRMVKMFTNFAKTLNPTPDADDLLQNVTWPKVTDGGSDSFLYVDIDVDLSIKDHPKDVIYREWNNIYSSLGRDDFDTY